MNRIIFDTGEKLQGAGVEAGRRSGFTIVELLIVIVVIGILAAISIVAYNGIQNRAHDTTIKNDLSNFAKQLHLSAADSGVFPPGGGFRNTPTSANGGAGTGFYDFKFRPSKESYKTHETNLVYCTAKDSGGSPAFVLRATSKSGKTFEYISTTSSISVFSTDPNFSMPHETAACLGNWGYPRSWSYGMYFENWSNWTN
ncbi:type IV pilin protein [Corynebacterium glutamicum]|uniref:type IV pilin protein n=1 Tax=Corynebacterium glutamicum TaxID=1718 RepID=UPI0009450018|nr:type II secretion system protein [Corynebacterium glutamicum]OKX84279.1 hypothetical protein AUO95_03600 [Corynebacterium glutamicum]